MPKKMLGVDLYTRNVKEFLHNPHKPQQHLAIKSYVKI